MKRWLVILAAATCSYFPSLGPAAEAPPTPLGVPEFRELFGLLSSNLTGISSTELNQAAVRGLIDQLKGRVALLSAESAPGGQDAGPRSLVTKATIFEDAYGYLSVAQVSSGLANEIRSALDRLRSTNKLVGLVIDLRFAGGSDYPAAAEAVDGFLSTEQPLFKWEGAMLRSTAKSNAIGLPVAILVNQHTLSAAEVLATLLRQAEIGLVIGSGTAGQAHAVKDFELSNGQKLRIATGKIELGNGRELDEHGITPDILLTMDPIEEKAYLENPYRVSPKLFAQSVKPGATNEAGIVLGSNRPPRRRLNEAELIRMRREGIEIDFDDAPLPAQNPSVPVVNDPVLARALDFLKGLAVIHGRN